MKIEMEYPDNAVDCHHAFEYDGLKCQNCGVDIRLYDVYTSYLETKNEK